ncbi:hypothetical protein B0T21DRAFT_202251 [Apiosordaria backusii]|uniref:Uncharacterized protein n=1 Tax=Apiosordaria backusii TaxID=314023 RepID=A0AA40BEQ9_9PEZI|nr:hypothetical protein B0T21DRAFT_202251 [Apiosordaria backusii]
MDIEQHRSHLAPPIANSHTTLSLTTPSSYTSTPIQRKLVIHDMPPKSVNNMNLQQSFSSAVDALEADDAMSDILPQQTSAPARAATASSRARGGRGRGGSRGGRGRGAKSSQPKAPAGRGRRQKLYEDSKVQAAHERAQELKQAWGVLVKLVKPAVQEIADTSINELLEDPSVVERVPEYDEAQKFLKQRYEDTLKQNDQILELSLQMARHVWEAEEEAARASFARRAEELQEERLGEILQQLDRLERQYNLKLPVDYPPPRDEHYTYKSITAAEQNAQGVFHEERDGIEVPFPGTSLKELMVKPQTMPLETLKRKAEGQPDGQPASKLLAAAKEDDAMRQLPRHTAGLLGGAEALEDGVTTPPDSASSAPTPLPELAGDVAEIPGQRRTSAEPNPADGPELPLPRGATDPDEYGVRIIARRNNKAENPNNRIMVPNLFEWGDLDIGFRDSTNSAEKGATKARRGKYWQKPGSNYMFIDRRVGIWDSTEVAGELPEAEVKKHNLHPSYGIFLPSSTNFPESPKPVADPWKPVVLVPPNGEVIHASRTIPAAKADRAFDELEAKLEGKKKFSALLSHLCEQEGISEEEIAPSADEIEQLRKEELEARGMDPNTMYQPSSAPPTPAPEPTVEQAAEFEQFAEDALRAAAILEDEEEARERAREREEEAARMAGQGAARAAAAKSAASKPYDAVRDALQFEDSSGSEDTTGLSVLADTAIQEHEATAHIDPRIYNPMRVDGMARDHHQYGPPVDYSHASEYPPPPEEYYGLPMSEGYHGVTIPMTRPAEAPLPSEPPRGDFLRTALNPQSPVYPPPPAPPHEYAAGQVPGGRTPFVTPGPSVGLPALRPVRSLLNDTPPPPEQQSSPVPQHSSMVVTNSGAFYPAGPSRPFHNGYSIPEPHQHLQPLMPAPGPGPLQAPPVAGPPSMPQIVPRPPSPLTGYPVSPPYHAPIAPAPALGVHAPILPAGSQPPAMQSPHSRPGSSSASAPAPAAAGGSAASSKYRKLEPAPTPPHRMTYSVNGQELRTVQFDYREAIKDYSAVEAPPRSGPTQIRGWTHQNIRKGPKPSSSRGDTNASSSNADESA